MKKCIISLLDVYVCITEKRQIVQNYKIADLIVSMQPYYEQISETSKKFLTDTCKRPDIIIPYTKETYIEYTNKYPHLSLNDSENILQAAYFAARLIDFNGITLHSSAILCFGKAYLFSAHSGVGKTTHTKLWQAYFGEENIKVINDDKPAIRCVNDEITAYGTPWSGLSYECENISAPVGGLIFIERGKTDKIERIKRTKSVLPLLLTQTIYKASAQRMAMVLETADKIITGVPVYKLTCTPTLNAVKVAADAIL